MILKVDEASSKGFSLIEVIVGIVIFAILATLFISFLGSPLRDSVQPMVRLQSTMALQQVMEDIRADFTVNKDLAALKMAIDAGAYGSYTVVQNGYITFDGGLEAVDTTDLDLLKVTIKGTTDELSLTRLFSVW